ncbi:MAG: hypothetical protein HYY20_08810 [Candidatus Tectomicrobia bacterium]|uniref:Uncharacterized protein n=1 Tax=Tectimicrobiota bacterium TaxID=2528274 RepID=A0A932CPM1_UNCTE|nr:hypothetical protein [Candidatus Tectomicrobia bacterium]
MKWKVGGFLFLSWLFLSVWPLSAQEAYEVDLPEIEKEIKRTAEKPYSLGGFGEFEPLVFGLDRDATFYRLRFFDRDEGEVLDQYDFRLRPEGTYRKGMLSLFARVDIPIRYDYRGWDSEVVLFEGVASLKPHPGFTLEVGKKVIKWGKGYAWNPVAFVDRPKDPEDPEEALEGFYLATANIIRSFAGPLKTVALTPVLLPVYNKVNDEFGGLQQVNFAAKLYLLLYDTDIDFMVFTGGSRTTRYGVDFAKNLRSNFEIHGEGALINDFETAVMNERGERSLRKADVMSYLLGLRYLTQQETTFILEYYRNSTGFTREEMGDFFRFVDTSYERFVQTGEESGLRRGLQLEKAYGRPNPMRHYLYFRASQKEPFDILYFTPALTSIVNITDGSFSLIPEFAYSPRTNLELRLRGAVLVGGKNTEYGEKQNDYRLELRVRYHFSW